MKLARPDKVGIAGISILILNILLQTIVFPSILKSKVKKRVALKNGWPMREIWSKLPFPIEHHWYIFTIVNPDEISLGERPILKEVGPFVYDMYQEKFNLEDHEEDDTLSYTMRNTYYFNKYKSNGLDQNDELLMPHLFLLGVANGLMRERPFLMPIASKAMDIVFNNPTSMFVKAKARTPLFDGFRIHCEGQNDFQAKVLCTELNASWDIFFLVRLNETSYSNSLWGPINGTVKITKRARIGRGTKNIKDVGKLVEYKGMNNFSAWDSDRCDKFQGTDYTIFPPFLNVKKKEDFYTSFSLMCKTFKFTYDSDVEYKGLKLLRYTTGLAADSRSNPEDQCFCTFPDDCPPDGLFDVYKCLRVPLMVSEPHFYQGDPDLQRSIGGLNPNKEKHQTMIDIDPLTGFAVRAYMRFQLSLTIKPLKKYRLMEKFPNGFLPIAWFDQQTILPDYLIDEIKACHRIITISNVFNYILILSGLAMCAYAGYHQYQLRREKKLNTITELSPASSANHSSQKKPSSQKQLPNSSATIPTIID